MSKEIKEAIKVKNHMNIGPLLYFLAQVEEEGEPQQQAHVPQEPCLIVRRKREKLQK